MHPNYITEKLGKHALPAWTMPMAFFPSRRNSEQFLPPNTFVHTDNFQSPKELAQDLLALDKDHVGSLSYFHWREMLPP